MVDWYFFILEILLRTVFHRLLKWDTYDIETNLSSWKSNLRQFLLQVKNKLMLMQGVGKKTKFSEKAAKMPLSGFFQLLVVFSGQRCRFLFLSKTVKTTTYFWLNLRWTIRHKITITATAFEKKQSMFLRSVLWYKIHNVWVLK